MNPTPPTETAEMQKLLEEYEHTVSSNNETVSACCGADLIEGSQEGPDGEWCSKCKKETFEAGTRTVNNSTEAILLSYIRTLEKEHRELRDTIVSALKNAAHDIDSEGRMDGSLIIGSSDAIAINKVLSSLTLKP